MKRILIVDNEPYIQEIVQICLETLAGWQVVKAGSGREGLLKAETEHPDAILLDVMMPDMDGLMTFQTLHTNIATQAIPVLLLTATIQPADRQRYSKLGITNIIAKPFDPLTLAAQMAEALGWPLSSLEGNSPLAAAS